MTEILTTNDVRDVLTGVASVACALLALALGQDANYDQQNYHFYIPYALLNDRILFDIFPALIAPTFNNPIPYLPFYWLAWNAPPMLTGALLGALYGLAYAPLYLLARTVPPVPVRRSAPAAMVLAAHKRGRRSEEHTSELQSRRDLV